MKFTGPVANTITGHLNLPKDNIFLVLDLGADANGNVLSTSSLHVSYSLNFLGQSIPFDIYLKNLSGTIQTKISGDASVGAFEPVDPTANPPTFKFVSAKGTGVVDLQNQTVQVTITTEGELKGLVELFNNGSDTLTQDAPDGTHEVINNVTAFDLNTLLSSPGTPTGTNGGTTGNTTGAGYAAPVLIPGPAKITINGALGTGELAGTSTDANNQTTAYFWTDPKSAPDLLPGPNGAESGTQAYGLFEIAGTQSVVGCYTDPTTVKTVAALWRPKSPGVFALVPLTNAPQGSCFRGASQNGGFIVGYRLSSTFQQIPIVYFNQQFYDLPTDPAHPNSSLVALGADNFHDVIGREVSSGGKQIAVVWKNVTFSGGHATATFAQLPDVGNSAGTPQAQHISSNGVIAGSDGQIALYWSRSDNFAPHALKLGQGNVASAAYAVNDAGTATAGGINPPNSTSIHLALWPGLTADPIDVTSGLNGNLNGFNNLAGFFLLSDYSIIALAQPTGSSAVKFVYLHKTGA
jgi:hypothetical protein